jgi:thiamine biosynthesis protein ThiI
MLRFADAVREEQGAIATVTGDCVGQVASQTLPNLGAVYDAGKPPILTPLAGLLKQEAVDRAKAIGTYDVSIRPGEDCCGLLVARHPRTRATAEELREIEAQYDLDALIAAALGEREIHGLKPAPA